MHKDKSKKNYLILTASGGGGLLQAANAEIQKIKTNDSSANIIKVDIMLQWLGLLGSFGVFAWNFAQKRGIVLYQKVLGHFQKVAEFIFWPKIFFRVLITLFSKDIDYVIDFQPLCTSATIKAIRIYNWIRKENVSLKKIIVDLPTKKSGHYFNNIKKLSKKEKKLISIVSLEPLLEINQTEKEFWKKFCKVSLEKVSYDQYPIRNGFYQYEKMQKTLDTYFIYIYMKNSNEVSLITSIIKKSTAIYKIRETNLEFSINKDDFVITILLGSQPAFASTFNYLQNIIKMIKENKIKRRIYVFAYCSLDENENNSKLQNFVKNIKNYPENLIIIPMSFQKEEIIASLFFRSDMTVTRSGGQTAVELMKVCDGKICVHSEHKSNNGKIPSESKLLKGIPVWEAGGASYMKEKLNATIITPDIFHSICLDLL